MLTLATLVVIAGAVYLLVKGTDVRLALIAAGLALASLALEPWRVLDAFRRTMGDGAIIGPICSAMGYSYILRATGSDREMVRLLVSPLRQVRWLLIPGGCVVGFVTNMAITSQTASAAAVGPILMPLMLAAGFSPIVAGATLVLGCSAGGNLFNPGEPDVVAIHEATKIPIPEVLRAMLGPQLAGFAAATTAFTALGLSEPRRREGPKADEDEGPIHLSKALLPPLPILMLLLLQPGLDFCPPILSLYPNGLPIVHAMVVSTLVALCVHRREVSAQVRAFFEGMGYAYIHVISLIIAASCFIEGMNSMGLTQKLVGVITGTGLWGKLSSGAATCALAVLSGSGTAPSVGFSQAVLPTLSAVDAPAAVGLGVLGAIGASYGRTMSPVAAVVVFTSTLVGVTPVQIVRRTAPALAAGLAAAFAVALVY